jgi:glycosyltransferase involved in cell wall biosynthesis
MDVSVIICTRNRARLLRCLLAALAPQSGMERWTWETIVVDNASTDDTAAVVQSTAFPVPLRYLYEPTPGKSFALNRAIAVASGRILAFTDDDIELTPGWLAGLVGTMERFDCAGAGGPVIPVWRSAKPDWAEDTGPYAMQGAIVDFQHGDEPVVLESAPLGGNSAYRREVFERHGVFRTDLGSIGACEDTEFARRVQRGGGELRYAPAAAVYHPVEPSRLTRRYFLRWYYARGRSEMVEEPPAATTVKYFGVPRYLFRSLAESLARWVVARSPSARFYHKLQAYSVVGSMREARALHRKSAAVG